MINVKGLNLFIDSLFSLPLNIYLAGPKKLFSNPILEIEFEILSSFFFSFKWKPWSARERTIRLHGRWKGHTLGAAVERTITSPLEGSPFYYFHRK